MAKMAPAVTRLWFHINTRNSVNYVDLSLAASAINRRFYRQSTTWAVAGMTLHTPSQITGDFTVSKVPDSWVAANAHTKAKRLWMKSQDQVLDNEPTIKARYNDFKVYLDKYMPTATLQEQSIDPTDAAATNTILLPVDQLNYPAKTGEWIYSQLQLPNAGGSLPPTEVTMHMVGNDFTSGPTDSRGIIHGYALSRQRPQKFDPSVPTTDGWMTDVFDVADLNEDIREDVSENNDQPPYRVGEYDGTDEFYPGGQNNTPGAALHSRSYVTTSTVGGKTHVEGGMFHCGLIKFDWNLAGSEDSMYLAIDLVPGRYKGYLTEAY